MTGSMIFRDAIANETAYLSSLALRSKAHWGYSKEFMQACIDELSVTATHIESNQYHCVVAITDEEILGFYMLEGQFGDAIELGGMFVDPAHIGTGVGKALMDKAKQHAMHLGASIMSIQADPNAEDFYLAAGGVPIGKKESGSIPGRFLPMLQISLSNKNVV